MIEFFKKLFDSDFLPHGTCYLWNPGVLWLNVISDLAIALAYYSIPVLLFWFVRKRRDIGFSWILAAFAAFILACGTTHLLGAWTVWHATYRLDGVVKAATAVASVTTAILLAPLLPGLVKMPNPAEVASMYHKLAQDTAELERVAEALRRQAELLELAHDAILVCGPEGSITFWNRGAEQFYGWQREQALGRRAHELLGTQFPENLGAVLGEIGKSGYWEGELVQVRRDGATLTVFSRWSARTHDGRLEVLEINHDISARKNLERANATFRQVLESAPDGIVVVNRDGAMVQVNSQTERLFGYGREELAGQPVEMLLPGPTRPGHADHRAGFFREPKVQPMGAGLDLNGRRKDGGEFPVEMSLSPIETEDGIQVIASVRDVTERKQFELALRQKNIELEKALAAKDLFLASMSHELRTPLNAILGFAGTLRMRLAGPLTADQERQLQRIQAAGKALLEQINEVLDLAKVESGALEIERKESSCREMLKEVASVVGPIAEAKSMGLDVDLPEPSVTVRTHQRAFTQIVVTLARQAVKCSDQGSLRIGTSETMHANGKMMAIHVTQSPGIKPQDQERIRKVFEHVQQGEPPKGSELGLYLCGKLADLIGGSLEVDSEAGHGSRLTLLVPRN
ncbi:MAG TPA: PAS domain S-box protein [Bryobacteraceae bacterium]|nr:PAS domain S-box protein [Bryobacteraceae bacterium]